MPKLLQGQEPVAEAKVPDTEKSDTDIIREVYGRGPDSPIPMIRPDGQPFFVPVENVAAAQAANWRVETPEQEISRRFTAAHPIESALSAMGKGIEEGMPLIKAQRRLMGKYVVGGLTGFDPTQLVETEEEAAKEAHPVVTTVSKIGAEVAPALAGGGGAAALGGRVEGAILGRVAAETGAKALGEAGLETLATQAAPSIARQFLGRVANYATQGVLTEVPKAAGELSLGEPGQAAETLLWGMGSGALLGGGSMGLQLVTRKGLGLVAKGAETLAMKPEAAAEVGGMVAGKAARIASSVAGHLVIPGIGGVAGYELGRRASGYARQYVKNALKAWSKDNVPVLANRIKDLAEGTGDGLGSALAGQGASSLNRRLAKLPSLLSALATGTGEKVFEGPSEAEQHSFDEVTSQLNKLAADPNYLTDVTSEVASVVSKDDDRVGQALQRKMVNMVEYLHAAQPKPDLPPQPFQQFHWRPTPQQEHSFMQKIEVARDPLTVFHRLQDGTLTESHVQALQAMYPDTYDSLQRAVMEVAATNRDMRIPYTQRVKLGMLVNVPLDPTMSASGINAAQAPFAPQPANQQQVEPPKGGPATSRKKSQQPKQFKVNVPDGSTEIQRVGSGQPGKEKA